MSDERETISKNPKSVVALTDEIESLRAELAAEREPVRELERAYDMLEMYGVPRQRARSVDNGIEVLASRYNKEIHSLSAVVAASQLSEQRLREALELITDVSYDSNVTAIAKRALDKQ